MSEVKTEAKKAPAKKTTTTAAASETPVKKAAPRKATTAKVATTTEAKTAVEKKPAVKRAASTKRKVEFRFHSPKSNSVQIVGSFNEWDATQGFMKKIDEENWSIILELTKGTHEYKFIFDSVSWEIDPNAPTVQTDLGLNNIVEVK